MLVFAWHVFLVIWGTGVIGAGFYIRDRRRAVHRRIDLDLIEQAKRTRIAELQARERRALDVH